MNDEEVHLMWREFLKFLNELGFNYHTGDKMYRYYGLYDDEAHRFIAHEQDMNCRSYLYYESLRDFSEGEMSIYSLMIYILPDKFTLEKWRSQEEERIHAYDQLRYVKIYPKNKSKKVLSEFRELMI